MQGEEHANSTQKYPSLDLEASRQTILGNISSHLPRSKHRTERNISAALTLQDQRQAQTGPLIRRIHSDAVPALEELTTTQRRHLHNADNQPVKQTSQRTTEVRLSSMVHLYLLEQLQSV